MLSKKIALIKLMEEVKSHSSKWIKTRDQECSDFYWQNGYGAFSFNPAQVEKTINYITNQRLHHQSTSFQEEYRLVLRKYRLDYDEKYIWD